MSEKCRLNYSKSSRRHPEIGRVVNVPFLFWNMFLFPIKYHNIYYKPTKSTFFSFLWSHYFYFIMVDMKWLRTEAWYFFSFQTTFGSYFYYEPILWHQKALCSKGNIGINVKAHNLGHAPFKKIYFSNLQGENCT